jgi:hypothetical protein
MTCSALFASTVTNILAPSGLKAMPSPPEPVVIVRERASDGAAYTAAVEGALQHMPT